MKSHLKLLIFQALLLAICAFLISAIFPINTTNISDTLTQSVWTEMESWKDKDGDGIFVFDTDSCLADNHWLFRSDSTFEMTEDITKCEPDMPFLDTIPGNWSLKYDETVLSLDLVEYDLDFQIYAIGEHELILYVIDNANPNAPTWEKIILRR